MLERFKTKKQSKENKPEKVSPFVNERELPSIDIKALSPTALEQLGKTSEQISTQVLEILEKSKDTKIIGDPNQREEDGYIKTVELSDDTSRLTVKDWNHRGIGYIHSITGEIDGVNLQVSTGFDADQGSSTRIIMSDTALEGTHTIKTEELDSIAFLVNADHWSVRTLPGHNVEGAVSSMDEILGKVDATLSRLLENPK